MRHSEICLNKNRILFVYSFIVTIFAVWNVGEGREYLPFLVLKIIFTMEIKELKKVVEQYLSELKSTQEIFLIEITCTASNVIEVTLDSIEGVSLERCIELSRYIESHFDRDVEDYELTVASASISEPFKIKQQFIKNLNDEVEVVLKDGQKMVGLLSQVEDDFFVLTYEKRVLEEGKKRKVTKEFSENIPYDSAKSVTLVIKF